MPTFYRWIATAEDAKYTTSYHNFTSMMVERSRVEELEALAIEKRDNEEYGIKDGLVIPLDVYEQSWNGDDSDTVEINVLPQLDGLCCFDNMVDALAYIGDYSNLFLMIFEGEQVGQVWDGLLAEVESVTEVLSGEEVEERFGHLLEVGE